MIRCITSLNKRVISSSSTGAFSIQWLYNFFFLFNSLISHPHDGVDFVWSVSDQSGSGHHAWHTWQWQVNSCSRFYLIIHTYTHIHIYPLLDTYWVTLTTESDYIIIKIHVCRLGFNRALLLLRNGHWMLDTFNFKSLDIIAMSTVVEWRYDIDGSGAVSRVWGWLYL